MMRSRRWLLPAAIVVLLAGMVALWKGSSPALPQQRTTKSDKRDDKFPSDAPAPAITLSVNCLSSASAREGSPLFIKAAISADHAEGRTIPFVLSKPGGRWSDFASVEIRDASGRIVSGLDLRSAYQTPASISINDNVSGTLVWIAQPAGGKLLPPGDYFVTAVLDASSSTDPTSWLGKTRSPACRLTVKPQSTPVSDAEARLAALVEIRIHGSLKASEAALSAANKYLAVHPKDRVILEEKGDVLASTGKLSEALDAYDEALANIPPQPESPYREPPEGLLIKRAKAEQALLKQGQK